MSNKLNKLARNLRNNSTDAERLLWRHLSTKQLEGLKFSRQEPIGDYIVDFICYGKSLIVEVDGGQHSDEVKDLERDKYLISKGFKVKRFWNNEVLTNIEGVIQVILEYCE